MSMTMTNLVTNLPPPTKAETGCVESFADLTDSMGRSDLPFSIHTLVSKQKKSIVYYQ
jgi:hypothetical protein